MKFVILVAVIYAFCFNSVFAGKLPVSGFCKKSKLAAGDGTQITKGFCSSVVQGDIPSSSKMTSTIILFPKNEGIIRAKTAFTAKVRVANLATGFFSKPPESTYYISPQTLNKYGVIQGHSHITIQQITGSGAQPLDASKFSFFKGLNDQAQNGILTAPVDPLGRGYYRMCTMAAADTHQPVLMPVAKRGAQDDCIRFHVR